MKILFIGDVIGRPGRRAIENWIETLKQERNVDLVLANAENVASGFGLTTETAEQLFAAGIHVLTGGNHIFDKEEGHRIIDRDPRIVRPANFPPHTPGRGFGLYEVGDVTVGVLAVVGRKFMPPVDCPFRTLDAILESLRDRTSVVIVDFHAKATEEKLALGWYLDGRVSAVVGSHTHVATADEQILPQGTAYITEVGMTGPYDSVNGVQKEIALQRILGRLPVRPLLAEGNVTLSAVLIDVDPITGRATGIERIQKNGDF